MLDLQQKTSILEKILQEPPQNYADGFKEDILNCLEGLNTETVHSMFLSKQDTEEDIRQWVDKLTSRIVMHEHEDGIDNIIWDYICCG